MTDHHSALDIRFALHLNGGCRGSIGHTHHQAENFAIGGQTDRGIQDNQ